MESGSFKCAIGRARNRRRVVPALLAVLAMSAIGAPLLGEPSNRAKKEKISMDAAENFINMDGTVVILGASYAAGWHPDGIGRLRFVNRGAAGERSFEMRARFDRDVLLNRANGVIIWGFINDIQAAPRDRIEETLTGVKTNLDAMVKRAREKGIVPILATEVTIRGKKGLFEEMAIVIGGILGKKGYQDYVNRHVLNTNQWLREYAAREKVFLLDLQPVLSDMDGLRRRDFAQDDGSHITPAGYENLNRYAQETITKFIK